jgi:hypothetical protein
VLVGLEDGKKSLPYPVYVLIVWFMCLQDHFNMSLNINGTFPLKGPTSRSRNCTLNMAHYGIYCTTVLKRPLNLKRALISTNATVVDGSQLRWEKELQINLELSRHSTEAYATASVWLQDLTFLQLGNITPTADFVQFCDPSADECSRTYRVQYLSLERSTRRSSPRQPATASSPRLRLADTTFLRT